MRFRWLLFLDKAITFLFDLWCSIDFNHKDSLNFIVNPLLSTNNIASSNKHFTAAESVIILKVSNHSCTNTKNKLSRQLLTSRNVFSLVIFSYNSVPVTNNKDTNYFYNLFILSKGFSRFKKYSKNIKCIERHYDFIT